MPGKDTNIGAKRARETRSQLGLEDGAPVPCLLTLVERDLMIPVVVAALPETIAGCCWREGDQIILWINGTQAPVRQRFTLAHELGHVQCAHDLHIAVDTFETLAGKTTDSREIQANAFAAEMLAPADGVRAMLDGEPSLEDVVRVAARFGISTIAALYRLNSLGLTVRYEALKNEIDEGLHADVWDRLAPEVTEDILGRLRSSSLPRLSPSLADSALAAMIEGAASVQDVADVTGGNPAHLANGASLLGT